MLIPRPVSYCFVYCLFTIVLFTFPANAKVNNFVAWLKQLEQSFVANSAKGLFV